MSFQLIEQKLIPCVNRARQAPMNTITVRVLHFMSPHMVIGMSIRPTQHHFSCVQHQKLQTPLPSFPSRSSELLHLNLVRLKNVTIKLHFLLPIRLSPLTTPSFVPLRILEVCRGECSQKCHPLVPFHLYYGSQCSSERFSVSMVVTQLCDVALLTLVAPYNLSFFVEQCWPKEPLPS